METQHLFSSAMFSFFPWMIVLEVRLLVWWKHQVVNEQAVLS